MLRRILLAVTVAGVLCVTGAVTKTATSTAAAHHVKRHTCTTKACDRRVARKLRLKRERAEMRRYRRNPMPWCTWGPESGRGRGQWSMARYRQPNVSGGSGGGKFQILDSTWHGFGGGRYASTAYRARPVYQERVARRILRGQGLGAWVGC
jgi:hypothetical protein